MRAQARDRLSVLGPVEMVGMVDQPRLDTA